MTQREVYEHLLKENRTRAVTRMISPNSPENFIEMAEHTAIIETIRNTWYWFNNQEEFISKCFFPIN